jgi:hypothetical protein
MTSRPVRALLGASVAACLLLAGCSDDGASGDGGEGPSAAETPYLPVPDGVELTAQGSELELGETATVAYEPRQELVGALDITVTRTDQANFRLFSGWQLKAETRKTTPYFVHAKIRNVGETDLGGLRPPLYAVDGANRLVESSTFGSTFKPCPSADFPKRFRTGDTVKTCLVYLAPDRGELTGVSFRPTEEFDPIVWSGEVTKLEAPKEKRDKKRDKRGGKG